MSNSVTPPIVTDDRGDIAFYPSTDAACLDLEAIDVLDGAYDVFDSKGNRLVVSAEGETVRIGSDPRRQPEPEELTGRLRRFVTRVGADRVGLADSETASLPELVHALEVFFGLG